MNPIPSKVLCKVLVVRHVCIMLQKTYQSLDSQVEFEAFQKPKIN
jgi:hypothetical protein